jgi:L-glyceraldehyde 3-phosphate reductase
VRSGKALYAGLSNYSPEQTIEATRLLLEMGVPCPVHQPRYSLLDRKAESGLLDTLTSLGMGAVVYSPLAKGLLTDRYFRGIPADSRAGHDPRFLRPADVTEAVVERSRQLNEVARARGQTLAQMALAWVLRRPAVTSAIIGASRPAQVEDCAAAARNLAFAPEELARIEQMLAS